MKVSEGVFLFDGARGNVYAIETSEGLVLIDSGIPGNRKKIIEFIRSEAGAEPHSVKYIILTHGHVDHTGSLFEVREATGAKVAAHENEAEFISGKKRMPMPPGIASLAVKAMGVVMKAQPVEVDILLKEGDEIAGFRVLHIPGHTPGSIALYDKKRGIMVVGDLLREEGGKITGPPQRFTIDMGQARESMKKIANEKFDIMLPGHGKPVQPRASEKVKGFVRLMGDA